MSTPLVPVFRLRQPGEPTLTERMNSPEGLEIRKRLVAAIDAERVENQRRLDTKIIGWLTEAVNESRIRSLVG